jgi:hypothetical protein
MENLKTKTFTKGSVIVEEIKVGDIHYEYEYGFCIKSKVLTSPIVNDDGNWEWQSESLSDGRVINYLVNPKYSHYGPNLYDYEAYDGSRYL